MIDPKRLTALATALLLSIATSATAMPTAPAAPQDEASAVKRAALDYLEGFYEGDTSKLRRSVRPEVVKYGFARRSADGPYQGTAMSFDQMIAFAEGVKASGRSRPDSDPKKVEILDILDQTATVKVTAYWGTDYLQLAKYDGTWMILHVLWQTPGAPTS